MTSSVRLPPPTYASPVPDAQRDAVPALVTVHLWGVPSRAVPSAFIAMGRDRRPLHQVPGLRFGKLLGTGSGESFTPRDADPRHWGVLATWDSAEAADAFEDSDLVRRWDARADERVRLALRPLTSKGRWAGRTPFGDPSPTKHDGPVAALTRARIKPRLWRTFWSSVPPVSAKLNDSPGLMLRVGIGEAPVGLQGTFSMWASSNALRDFAHRSAEHQAVIARTRELDWYSEELFARFAVLAAEGDYAGTRFDLPAP